MVSRPEQRLLLTYHTRRGPWICVAPEAAAINDMDCTLLLL